MSLLPLIEPGAGDDSQNAFLAQTPPLNLFKALANAPGLAGLTAQFGGFLLFQSELDPKVREVAILRAAWMVGNAYEIGHHERIGRDVGLDEPALSAARSGMVEGLPEDQALGLRWAEEVLTDHAASERLASRAIELLGIRPTIELSLTVGYYLMVAQFLDSFRIPFEGEDFKDGVQVAEL